VPRKERKSLQNIIYVDTTISRKEFLKAVEEAIYAKYKMSYQQFGEMPIRWKWEKGKITFEDEGILLV